MNTRLVPANAVQRAAHKIACESDIFPGESFGDRLNMIAGLIEKEFTPDTALEYWCEYFAYPSSASELPMIEFAEAYFRHRLGITRTVEDVNRDQAREMTQAIGPINEEAGNV